MPLPQYIVCVIIFSLAAGVRGFFFFRIMAEVLDYEQGSSYVASVGASFSGLGSLLFLFLLTWGQNHSWALLITLGLMAQLFANVIPAIVVAIVRYRRNAIAVCRLVFRKSRHEPNDYDI